MTVTMLHLTADRVLRVRVNDPAMTPYMFCGYSTGVGETAQLVGVGVVRRCLRVSVDG